MHSIIVRYTEKHTMLWESMRVAANCAQKEMIK